MLMAHKKVGQMSWLDAAASRTLGSRRDKLSEISALLNWSPFEGLLSPIHSSQRGELAYPPLAMFKVLLLQRWYELSDPEMEEALADRLSFRAFAGFSLEDPVPDHSTIWRFREQLAKRRLTAPLLAELNRQLDGHGVLLKQGTLIDATIVQAQARRPRMTEAKTSAVDPDARFGTNNERRRYHFGYKLHAAVDGGSGLVRAVRVTPANVQEIDLASELVQGDESAVYADRGYDAKRLHDHLARAGIADGVMRRGRKGQALSPEQIERNHMLSLRRRPVEKLFGTLKRSYRMARVPYFNLNRNTVALTVACFAYNLRRLHALSAP
jgi:IS5 family transposase